MLEETRLNLQTLTVSQLTASIKLHLEKRFAFVAVQGEVSNLKQQASGHVYFTLKDKESQISAVLFRGAAGLLSSLPKDGDQIIVKGELSVYAPRGNYQIIVREVEKVGVGELLKKFHELKEKLQGLGWFDQSRKKTLPKLPKTIGVITSPTGAVIQDIQHVLARRFPGFHLIINPVRVQGAEAKFEIVKAIEQFNQHKLVDLLIIARGGGSLEDLWPFNEEMVAEAIKNSLIPTISAVGHETDFSLSDFAADCRAPTPSAAAEIALPEKSSYLAQLEKMGSRAGSTLLSLLNFLKQSLARIQKQPLFSSAEIFLAPFYQKVDLVSEDLQESMQQLIAQKRALLHALSKKKEALKPGAHIPIYRRQLEQMQSLLVNRINHILKHKKEAVSTLSAHLQSLSPKNVLSRGYAILFREKKSSVILSAGELAPQEKICILLKGGELEAEVLKIKKDGMDG